MSLATFAVVIVGESFPVQSIKIQDFTFRHRGLTETMRLPIALQAENAFVAMQILPERFEVTVKSADHVPEQIEGVTDMVHTLLEYVGKRSISAMGHNAQWRIAGSETSKSQLRARLSREDVLQELVGAPPSSTDVTTFFNRGSSSQARAIFQTSAPGDAMIDFNFNYDLTTRLTTVDTALNALSDSIALVAEIGQATERTMTEVATS